MQSSSSSGASNVNLNPHYRGRVRSGCLTCRKAKVRCDEQHPLCNRCVRLKRHCVYETKSFGNGNGALSNANKRTSIYRKLSATNGPDLDLAGPSQTHYLSPSDSTVLLPGILELSRTHARSTSGAGALSLMTSHDIYLCTTIDWLAANEGLRDPSFSYFLNEVDFPLITPFDPFNWTRMKTYAVELASKHKSVAAAIAAVQLLFRAQTHFLPTNSAVAQYELARRVFEATLHQGIEEFDVTLVNVFIITLFSTVNMDDSECTLKQPGGSFVEALQAWSSSGVRTPTARRIAAWLKIMHAAARRGGNPGIISVRISNLLSNLNDETPSLHSLVSENENSPIALESVNASIFSFYLDLQEISLQIANLSHYHRSRTTGIDQEEVVGLMAALKARLDSLWQSRPALMKCEPHEIRTQFSFSTAEALISSVAVSKAAYYVELIDMGRSLGDPLSITPEAQNAIHQIHDLVDGDWNASCRGSLNPGYLRPLFLCAIESKDSEIIDWALCRMREIRDPICRSNFFASYAEALVEAQRTKGRRVTTRWFCYQQYGVRPPLL